MKVGTDAMLLGAWAPLKGISTALEIGCGCGIISLMMAQRKPQMKIVAIDIDDDSVRECAGNFSHSPWKDQMNVEQISLREIAATGGKFDLIVSNPPYFQNSLKSPDSRRNLARHNVELEPASLFRYANQLCHENSALALVFPHGAYELWHDHATLNGFYIKTLCEILPETHKKAAICLSLWSKQVCSPKEENISILNQGIYSVEYQNLLKDFLIIF